MVKALFTQDVGCDAQCNASKCDLLSMGVFTLHASNIKGKTFQFCMRVAWRVLCEFSLRRTLPTVWVPNIVPLEAAVSGH